MKPISRRTPPLTKSHHPRQTRRWTLHRAPAPLPPALPLRRRPTPQPRVQWAAVPELEPWEAAQELEQPVPALAANFTQVCQCNNAPACLVQVGYEAGAWRPFFYTLIVRA